MENDVVDRLIDKHGDVQSAMLFVHKKIDEYIDRIQIEKRTYIGWRIG